jgi:sugar lactone lactonase YvrE
LEITVQRRIIAFAGALALVAVACSSGVAGDSDGSPTTTGSSTTVADSYAGDTPAPDFPDGLDWLNTGRPLSLAELRGKVVLLDFWTYGCINCIHIIPDLKRLEAEYPGELIVIGVHSAKFDNEADTENIRQIILRYELEHPVVNDAGFEVWNTWGARAWPTTALIDPAGNVVGSHSGEGVYEVVEPVIASLVAEFDASGLLDRSPLDFTTEAEGLPDTVLSFPGKVLATEDGRLFISDTNHHRIVGADATTGEVFAVYGSGIAGFVDGPPTSASFFQPQGLALSPDGNVLFVADTGNHAVRAIGLDDGVVATVTGTGQQGRWPPAGGLAPDVALNSPWALELRNDVLYVANAGSHQIWSIFLQSGLVAPAVGSAAEGTRNGLLANAELAQPSGLAFDDDGRLYFADSESSSIRWADVTQEGGYAGVLVGSDANLFDFGDVDGIGTDARLQHPLGIAYRAGVLYVADTYNSKIKQVDIDSREITTFLGDEHGWRDGTDPLFYEPGGISVAGDMLYVADTNNHAVRVVALPGGDTSTLVLKGIEQFEPDPLEAGYRGNIIDLPAITTGPGDGSITLAVVLPDGYKINDQAPSIVEWSVAGDVVSVADADLTGTTFPQQLPAVFTEGEGTLRGDFTLIYCPEDAETLCLIEQFLVTIPLVVAGEATSPGLLLPYEIELPPEVTG